MKPVFYFLILLSGIGLSYFLVQTQNRQDPTSASFVPIFKVAGMVPQAMSRSVSKVLPIDSIDEGEFGKQLNLSYSSDVVDKKIDSYLTNLLKEIVKNKKKPFEYHIHLLDNPLPNAMALPGGVILITRGLLSTIKSEGELVGIIAHEMGHIELSHCFDSVKYEILTRKYSMDNIGALADIARNILITHSFSKTQEDEADEYGFKLLTLGKYDPSSLGNSFNHLNDVDMNNYTNTVNPFRDYFMSHPPMSQRMYKYSGMAKAWWERNPNVLRYVGKQNLLEFTDLTTKDFGSEERISGIAQ